MIVPSSPIVSCQVSRNSTNIVQGVTLAMPAPPSIRKTSTRKGYLHDRGPSTPVRDMRLSEHYTFKRESVGVPDAEIWIWIKNTSLCINVTIML